MDSVFILLHQKPSNQVVKIIIKHGKTNFKEVDKNIYQFYIDLFGKNFQFTDEHYEEIEDSTVDLESLAFEIYESNDTDESQLEINLKEFVCSIVNELFIAELLNGSIVSNWVTFLASVADHRNIPKTSKIKGQAYLLLAYMLQPFAKIMALCDNPVVDVDEEFKTAIKRSLERIFNNISGAFEYEKYALDCAKEFAETLLDYNVFLQNNSALLNHYRKMLLYDNRPMLALAIKSIGDLCDIDDLEDVMKEFLFSANNNDETVVQIIMKLVNYKNLRLEVLGFLKTIASLRSENDVLTANEYSELFSNICSRSKKTIAETADLMISLQVDFWLELIKVLNFHADDDIDLKLILSSIQSSVDTNLDTILKVVEENINEPIVSRRAAEIFNEAFEMSYLKDESIGSLINTMKACVSDETTFILLLQTFSSLENEMLVTFLKENVNYLTQTLMTVISNAFLDYQKPSSLNFIVNALKKLYVIEPITILCRVRDIAKGFFEVLMGLKNVEFTEREKIVPKLTALFECKAWRLLNDKSMIDLYNFCQKYCTNVNYKYFPQFQRLYVNLLKHFWMMVATHKPLLIENDKFIKETRHIHAQIHNYLKGSKSIADNCLLLTSLIDLHVLFQPKVPEKLTNNFFKTFNIPLSKEDFIRLIDLMEQNLFPENDDSMYYQLMLMQSFVTFFLNYTSLPSLTSWETFLRYYNSKSSYKFEIETIMNHVIKMKKTIFEKSVAFAILNMVGMYSLEQFKSFFHTLDDFMRNKFPDFKDRNVAYGLICSIVLERFSKTITANSDDVHRLIVLEYIGIIVKNFDQSFSRNLIKFIKINENFLTDFEKRKLNEFKRMLCED